MNANTITIGEVRFSYCNLFQPRANQQGQEPKYSATILVPKSNAAAKAAIDAAIQAAIDAGVSKCWNGVRPPQPSICVHDGDGVRPSDGMPYGDECKGHWVFTASAQASKPPYVVDADIQPILRQSEIYSGMYGRANVSFFPYNASGKKGIGCGLNGVQKLRDGEPLGGGVTAAEAFGSPAAADPAAGGWAAPAPNWGTPAAPAAEPGYTNPWG